MRDLLHLGARFHYAEKPVKSLRTGDVESMYDISRSEPGIEVHCHDLWDILIKS